MKALKFLATDKVKRACRKAKHGIGKELDSTVRKVLVFNPEYGVPIPRFGSLRKMRVAIPDQGFGKRGGYRLIYRTQIVDETRYFVFLSVYFKSDTEDLSRDEYQELINLSQDILENWLDFTWDDFDLTTL